MEIFDGDAEEMHSRLFANGSDGCASLTGRKKGAMTQFKHKQPRQLFSHCSGHKLALVASDAADSVEGMDEFDKAVPSFVNHFAYSVKRREAFKEMQVLVDDAKVSLLRKGIKVRWLSKIHMTVPLAQMTVM